jgi:hypothetical protein
MLCDYCQKLSFAGDPSLSRERDYTIPHQPSYLELHKSAAKGCELCLLFRECLVNVDPSKTLEPGRNMHSKYCERVKRNLSGSGLNTDSRKHAKIARRYQETTLPVYDPVKASRLEACRIVLRSRGPFRDGFSIGMTGYPEVAPVQVYANLGKLECILNQLRITDN